MSTKQRDPHSFVWRYAAAARGMPRAETVALDRAPAGSVLRQERHVVPLVHPDQTAPEERE